MGFWRQVFASFLGALLALFVMGIISWILTIAVLTVSFKGVIKGLSKLDDLSKGARFLLIKFDKPLSEDPRGSTSFDLLRSGLGRRTLFYLYSALDKAADDDDIKGVLVDLRDVKISLSKADAVRSLLEYFRKKADKPVICYGEIMGASEVLISTACDSVYMLPEGFIGIAGFKAQSIFYKRLLNKLGIKAEVIHMKEYKTAAEPLVREEFSRYSREMLSDILRSIENYWASTVAGTINLDAEQLLDRIKREPLILGDEAISIGLITGVSPWSKLVKQLVSSYGLDEEEPYVDWFHYLKGRYGEFAFLLEEADFENSDSIIAVVVLEGAVVSDAHSKKGIAPDKVFKILHKLEQDDKVVAVVIRVNSVGGDLWSSEEIWHMLNNFSKPVVVSMGSIAGSGGYYIALPADSIIAEPMTLTGSIGVVLTHFDAGALLREKLYLDMDTIKTSPWADFFSVWRPLNARERNLLYREALRYYRLFVQRVAISRNLDTSYVESIAKGRVYTGTKAVRLKLVDRIGYLQDAIETVAHMTGVKNYKVELFPKVKGLFDLSSLGELSVYPGDYHFVSYQEKQAMTGLVDMLMSYRQPGVYLIMPLVEVYP